MKKSILYSILFFALILSSCEKDMELSKSIYIVDTEYPALPAYSEWGYNTFGAYFDREIFRSNDKLIPLKVIIRNDTVSFLFKGQKGAQTYNSKNYTYTYVDMSIELTIPDLKIEELDDLITLNDTTINLNSSVCDVNIIIASNHFNSELLNGKLQFKKSRKLIVDENLFGIILSGFFDFHILTNGEPMSISGGRFDVSVNSSNFISY